MSRIIAALSLAVLTGAALQVPSSVQNPLLRRYREGEHLSYHMYATNEGSHYEIQASGQVKRDSAGLYFEEYTWSDFSFNGQQVSLSPAMRNFRQRVTLDPDGHIVPPNLGQVDPRIIGPLTDFMTFYVDLWLAAKAGNLAHPGDHAYVKRGAPNSWADGTRVVAGQDSIDFDLSFQSVDSLDNVAVILVRHVPPEEPRIDLPAIWMHTPVANTQNNWFEVDKTRSGTYTAAVGKETFDVELKVSLADGKMMSATLDNPVSTIERDCVDAALMSCGKPKSHHITRHVEITLARPTGA